MDRNLRGARPGRGVRGQALTEFALVVPMLLLMVVGIMEFGRAWQQSQVVTDAARQGARAAAIFSGELCNNLGEVRDVVKNALEAGNINATDGMVKFPEGCSGGTNTQAVVLVEVPYNFGVFKPVMTLARQSFNDNGFRLRSRATMRKE